MFMPHNIDVKPDATKVESLSPMLEIQPIRIRRERGREDEIDKTIFDICSSNSLEGPSNARLNSPMSTSGQEGELFAPSDILNSPMFSGDQVDELTTTSKVKSIGNKVLRSIHRSVSKLFPTVKWCPLWQ